MVICIVWGTVSIACSLALRRRPHMLVALILVLYVLIPSSVDVIPYMHPADYLLVAMAAVQAQPEWGVLPPVYRRHRAILQLSVLTALLILISSGATKGFSTSMVSNVLHTTVLPLLFFMLVNGTLRPDKSGKVLQFYAWTAAFLIVFQSALGWAQYRLHSPILWTKAFQSQWWWGASNLLMQPVGTFGHWIPYSSFLAGSLFIASLCRSLMARLLTYAAAFSAIVISASRTGLLMFGVFVVYLLLQLMGGTLTQRRFSTAFWAILAAVLGAGFLGSSDASHLLSRLDNDGGSAGIRAYASEWFWNHLDEFLFTGYPGDTDLRASGVLSSSLENAFYMFAVEYGLIAAALLTGLLCCALLTVLQSRCYYRLTGICMGVCMLIPMLTSGYFMVGFVEGLFLFWAGIAIGLSGPSERYQ